MKKKLSKQTNILHKQMELKKGTQRKEINRASNGTK